MSRRTVALRIAALVAVSMVGCAPSVEVTPSPSAPTPSTSPSPWFTAGQLALEARTAECRDIAEDLLKSHRAKEKAVTGEGRQRQLRSAAAGAARLTRW